MNKFELKIWDDESSLCTFYSVQWDESSDNETDKFFSKYEHLEGLKEAAQELLSFILISMEKNKAP